MKVPRLRLVPNFIKRRISRRIDRVERSGYINDSDKEVIYALERIFVLDPPNDTDPGSLELDYNFPRIMLASLIFLTPIQLVNKISEHEIEELGTIYGSTVSFFFTILFIRLHSETKQTGFILLLLTYLSGVLGLWMT